MRNMWNYTDNFLKDICLNLKSRWGAIKSGRPTTWLADSNRAVNRVKHSMVSFRRRGSFQEIICQACAIPFHYQHCGLIVQFNVQLNVLSTHKFFSNIFWIYSFKIYLFFPWIYSSENVFHYNVEGWQWTFDIQTLKHNFLEHIQNLRWN